MALATRRAPFRDSSLFVLGLEGESSGAEYGYFEKILESNWLDARRVRFVLLPASEVRHDSDPGAVLGRVKEYAAKHDLKPFDRVWLVLDVDSWGEKKLSDVARQARDADYMLAASNPCFEVWLLMHHECFDPVPIREATVRQRSAAAKSAWKSRKTELSSDTVLRACSCARELDSAGESHLRWPSCPGSRLYLLFDDLEARRALRSPV